MIRERQRHLTVQYCSCDSPRRCVAQTKAGLGAPWPGYRRPIHGAERSKFLQTFKGSPRQPGPLHHSPPSAFSFTVHPLRHGDRQCGNENLTQPVSPLSVCLARTHKRRARKCGKSRKCGNERCRRCPATGWLVHAEGRRGSRGHALPL